MLPNRNFVAEKIVSEDESGAEQNPEEYTQYMDLKYAEQLMSESLATSIEPSERLPARVLAAKQS